MGTPSQSPREDGETKAIIIMGASVLPGGAPSPTIRRRTACAASLWRQQGGFLIPTGSIGGHPPSEAQVMADLLRATGVPARNILCEHQARSTLENALFSAEILKAHGLSDVTLVTDSYHALRSRMCFARLGVSVRCLSASAHAPRPRATVHLKHWAREAVALPAYAVKLALFRR